MDSKMFQDLELMGAALAALVGAAIALGQAPAWTEARATGSDAGMTVAFGGVALFAAGLGGLVGALCDLSSAGQLLLGGLGYILALVIAIAALALVVGSWEPILDGVVVTVLFIGVAEVARRTGARE